MSVEGVDTTEAAVLASLLSSDKIPDENQSTSCMACGETMTGLFCSACGQKNDNYRRSIFALIADLFGSIFSLESRIWRTWGALLFKPGKVAREFSDGKRTYWSSPVRVYLAISIILFGFMSVTNTHLMSLDVNAVVKEGVSKPRSELTPADIQVQLNPPRFFETQTQLEKRNEDIDFELLELCFSSAAKDNASVIVDTETGADSHCGKFFLILAGREFSGEEAGDIIVNFVRNPIAMTRSFNTWLPRLMFVMMPFTMLLGALFIRDKKKALLFDHLVHSAYVHAVAFFLFFVGILASKVIGGGVVVGIIAVFMIIFLPLSLKRMFGRGWFKTLLTSYLVGLIYLILTFAALSFAMAFDIGQQITA